MPHGAAKAPLTVTHIVPNFSFGSWFERMGYDRPGGEEECAEMLDITVKHLRRLCRGQRFPSSHCPS